MALTSLTFFLFTVLAAAIVGLSRAPIWRKGSLLLASLTFIASYVPNALSVVPFVAFLLVGYGAILACRRWPAGHAIGGVVIAAFVGLFLWLKHYAFVGFLPHLAFPYLMLGASYVLFRILHLAFEVRDEAMQPPGVLDYLVYVLFFPAFLSGPVNRYEGFATDLVEPRAIDHDTAYRTLGRIILGFARIAVAGEIARLIQADWAGRVEAALAGGPGLIMAVPFAAAAVLYFGFLYLNFAGSMDIAIGVARMFGIVLPENFDRPLRAASFQDLWARWHITLSNWFKVYFYNPLLKALMMRFGASPALAPYLSMITSFIVFLVLGAWHGASWEFMLCGVFFATGVSANQFYQMQMTRWLGKKSYKALAARPLYILTGRGLTIGWFSLALTPFWLNVAQMGQLWSVLGPIGLIAAYAALTLGLTAAFLVWDVAREVLPNRTTETGPRPAGLVLRGALLGLAVIALLFLLPLVNSQPELVYKAF